MATNNPINIDEFIHTLFIFRFKTGLVEMICDKKFLQHMNIKYLKKYSGEEYEIQQNYLKGNIDFSININKYPGFSEDLVQNLYIYLTIFLSEPSNLDNFSYYLNSISEGQEIKNALSKSMIFPFSSNENINIIFFIIHPSQISKHRDYINEMENIFYKNIFIHIDYSFFSIDHILGKKYLQNAIQLYPYLSQLYALQVRMYFFISFYRAHPKNQIGYRKNNTTLNLHKKIQSSIILSNKCVENNITILIFEIAYYLHIFQLKGVVYLLRLQKHGLLLSSHQKYNLSLWIGKYFVRMRNFKSAEYYLFQKVYYNSYFDSKEPFQLLKFQLIFSIYFQKRKVFNKIYKKLQMLYNIDYDFADYQGKYIYIGNETRKQFTYNDEYIILPYKSKQDKKFYYERINAFFIHENEKNLWEHVVIFYKK